MVTTTSNFSKEQEELDFIKIVQVTTNKITNVIKEYNDTLLVSRMENGKQHINQRYADAVQTMRRYHQLYLLKKLETGKKKIETRYVILKHWVDHQYQSVLSRLNRTLDTSKASLKRMTGINAINHTLNNSMNIVPVLVNLPSKQEIKQLTQRIEALNQQLALQLDKTNR